MNFKEGDTAQITTQKLTKYDDSVCHILKFGAIVKVVKYVRNWIVVKDEQSQLEQYVSQFDLCPTDQENLKFN